MTDIAVMMPAYNAERSLEGVVGRVTGAMPGRLSTLVIVNDGSTDDTGAIADRLSTLHSVITVIHRPRNGGYGAAMKDGLKHAASMTPRVAACVHADGQYAPEELPHLVAGLLEGGYDILQGSRIASGTASSGGMPWYKIIGNAMLNRLETRVFDVPLTDFHSGYLLYSARALQLPFCRLSNSFDFDLEVIASALAQGLRVGELPVPTHYGEERSYLSPIPYGLRILKVMWNYRRGHYA